MKKRIAIVLNCMPINGISTVVMNYVKYIDKKNFELTIFTSDPIAKMYKEECKKNNTRIVKTPQKRSKSFLKYYLFLKKNLDANKYDIVHVHGSSSTIGIELFIAAMNGIKKRIAHCHSTSCSSRMLHKLLLPLCNRYATIKIACSKDAGNWLYPQKEFTILTNAFHVEKFKYDEEARQTIRKDLKIPETSYVIGHIGRFNGTKNQEYLLELFNEFANKFKDSYLLLVGTGPDHNSFKEMIHKHKYKERIILYGESQKVEKLYSVMDVFAFPSKYEGLGIVGIEAQLSGLKCVASTNVPKEIDITNNVEFISTDRENIRKWNNALKIDKSILNRKKIDFDSELINKYKIEKVIEKLEKIYKD